MRQGATQIRRSFSTSGKSGVTNDNTIVLGAIFVVGGESSVSKEAVGGFVIERNGEDVENIGTTAPELFLHRFLFGGVWADVLEPLGVLGPGGIGKLELETGSGVVPIQDLDLVLDLLIPGT